MCCGQTRFASKLCKRVLLHSLKYTSVWLSEESVSREMSLNERRRPDLRRCSCVSLASSKSNFDSLWKQFSGKACLKDYGIISSKDLCKIIEGLSTYRPYRMMLSFRETKMSTSARWHNGILRVTHTMAVTSILASSMSMAAVPPVIAFMVLLRKQALGRGTEQSENVVGDCETHDAP